MRISQDEVKKISDLAHLELTEEEVDSFTAQLSAIVSYIDQLNELNTSGVAPMSHCQAGKDSPQYAWRNDEVVDGIGQHAALSNAPESASGYFKVPKVI